MLVASLVALYFGVGVLAAVAGPAGSDIREEYRGVLATPNVYFQDEGNGLPVGPDDRRRPPLARPRSLRGRVGRGERRRREPNLFDLIDTMGKNGTEQDHILGAVGEFGLSPASPIPTRSIIGNMAYLARLRTASGERVVYARRR